MDIFKSEAYKDLKGKEKEFFDFLAKSLSWNEIINDEKTNPSIKKGVRITISRLLKLKFHGMFVFFWSAIADGYKGPGSHTLLKKHGNKTLADLRNGVRDKFDKHYYMIPKRKT
ncbi:MAG: hypothetical protein A2452_06855 [Candidatus Firestonebacteria bacterium RIFOXYC2_FULL_39_67]|nr:MAG: hypothetical protein A2452_06855 [Candidatus Firestonebacteria bacterium RIFOXYC2_FULL_39_67]OGF58028.1 MAG: hypothetical protein A2497_04685 [Candidatus Firestonebacteria bacterium RifOxyC12_full_39_7]